VANAGGTSVSPATPGEIGLWVNMQLGDAYLSVVEALRHAAIAMDGDLTCAGSTLKTRN